MVTRSASLKSVQLREIAVYCEVTRALSNSASHAPSAIITPAPPSSTISKPTTKAAASRQTIAFQRSKTYLSTAAPMNRTKGYLNQTVQPHNKPPANAHSQDRH